MAWVAGVGNTLEQEGGREGGKKGEREHIMHNVLAHHAFGNESVIYTCIPVLPYYSTCVYLI